MSIQADNTKESLEALKIFEKVMRDNNGTNLGEQAVGSCSWNQAALVLYSSRVSKPLDKSFGFWLGFTKKKIKKPFELRECIISNT